MWDHIELTLHLDFTSLLYALDLPDNILVSLALRGCKSTDVSMRCFNGNLVFESRHFALWRQERGAFSYNLICALAPHQQSTS